MNEYIYAVILPALMLSFSHCLGMCGGFVVAYNLKLAKHTKISAFYHSLVYQISRIFSYILIGGLGGAFGSVFTFNQKTAGFMRFFTGILLVILGIAFIKRGEILKFIENDKLWKKFLSPLMKFAMSKDDLKSFALLGFLNGLLPCGVVYTFLITAIMSASIIDGMVVMGIFGLATLPAMLGASVVINLCDLKFKNSMLFISVLFIIGFGIYQAYLGFKATL